jgi:hypothetical protein
VLTYNDRLEHTDFTDAVNQFSEVVGVEVGARLHGVRDDVVRVEVDQSGSWHLDELLLFRTAADIVREEHVDRSPVFGHLLCRCGDE